MTGTNGHFEQGRWVDEPEPVTPGAETRIDARINTATSAVIAAMNDVANVTRDLVSSEEGKRYIEKKMASTRFAPAVG